MLAFFADRKIENANLIYSASENDFSVSAFHETCNDIPNTLTLCET